MRTRIANLAGAEFSIQKQQQGPGSSQPIRIDILGNDLNEVATATTDIIGRMRDMGGFVDVTDSRPLPGTEWSLVTDRDAASRHGVSISGLGMMIKMLTRGMRISDYRPDDAEDELDVMIRFLGNQRNIDRLKELRCQLPMAICSPVGVCQFGAAAQRRRYRTQGRPALHVYQI